MTESPAHAQTQAAPQSRYVGRGRSGVVLRHLDAQHGWVVRKWFQPDRASRWILRVFTGAPNPYAWNEDAVACAVLRRRILQVLCRYWFGSALVIPDTFGAVFRDAPRNHGIEMAYVPGRHAPLRSTFTGRSGRSFGHLQRTMRALQRHLEDSGFDGLLWQAGLGNPVAASNFLEGAAPGTSWVWIDLESGMLPLVPANPWRLVSHYLPSCVRHRAWLFDDVDVVRLRRYLHRHQPGLVDKVGANRVDELLEEITRLQRHQADWRGLRRHQRSLSWMAFDGRIDERTRTRYWTRPLAWYAWLAGALPAKVVPTGRRALHMVGRWIRRVRVRAWLRRATRFLMSARVRRRWARRYVLRRVRVWQGRRFLDRERARTIREDLARRDTGEFIADFGVHLACKPAIELVQWVITPLLFAVGWIPGAGTTALIMLLAGSVVRTAYTTGRSVQALLRGHPLPWVALAVGTLPSVGTLAFPSEMAWRGAARGDRLGQFILYDTSARFGRWFPIWGGRDTATEHLANRVPDALHALLGSGGVSR